MKKHEGFKNFRPSGLAINQDVYLEDCIKKKPVPFI